MSREDPKVNIRLPIGLKNQLHELAAKNKRSVNSEVVASIELALGLSNLSNEITAGKTNEVKKKPKIYTFTEQELQNLLAEITSLALKNIQ